MRQERQRKSKNGRGPESNWLRPPFQGGALPVSYPGTLESVNFRGGRKLCQIPRKSVDLSDAVSLRSKTKPGSTASERIRPAKTGPATAEAAAAAETVAGEHAAPKVIVLTIGHSTR